MAPTWPSCCSRRATRCTAWSGAPQPSDSSASSICATESPCTRPTCWTSARSSTRCVRRKPAEIYNLAAMSFVAVSWIQPTLTAEFTGVGVTRMLEAMREVCPEARFYQASSSEMFGKVREVPAERADAVLPALALRRGQGRTATSSRSTTVSPTTCTPAAGSCSTTSRRAGASSSSPARSPGTPRRSSSDCGQAGRWATSTPSVTGGMPRTTSRRCG